MPVSQAARLAWGQAKKAGQAVKPYLPYVAGAAAAVLGGVPIAIGAIVRQKIDVNNVELNDAEFLVGQDFRLTRKIFV